MYKSLIVWIVFLLGTASAERVLVYFGTYTGGESESQGIYASWMDQDSGVLSAPFLVTKADNPSFLEIHPNGKYLYAINVAEGVGKIRGYHIELPTGELTLINEQPSQGDGPCHVSLDHTGKYVLVANYSSGNAGVIPIQNDGQLAAPTGFVQHTGSSINQDRQKGPHAHSINVSPDNRFAFVADLGIDKIMIYTLDLKKGSLAPNDPPSAALDPGAGPRHFSFHPNGKYVYVINELSCTVTVFTYASATGELTAVQTISTLPAGFSGRNTCAEVRVHPTGKFLYGSNRGHDSIAIFTINQEDGTLTANGHMAKGIKTPRNFNIDPQGQFCVVANQGSDSVCVFRIAPDDGHLIPTDSVIQIGKPVCVRFLKPAK